MLLFISPFLFKKKKKITPVINQQKQKQLGHSSGVPSLLSLPTVSSGAPWGPVLAPPPNVTQPPPPNVVVPPTMTPQMQQLAEQMDSQKSSVTEQVKQSEQNLAAQYQSLITQQQVCQYFVQLLTLDNFKFTFLKKNKLCILFYRFLIRF